MEEVIKIIEDTIYKSTLDDLRDYLRENNGQHTWLMYSDYCLSDPQKPNDVISFSIMPYDDDFDKIRDRIGSLAPTDIKKKRSINSDLIAYLKEKRLFHMNFILGSRKGLTQAKGFIEKDVVIGSINKTWEMLDVWCVNTPTNAVSFRETQRKLTVARNELSKKSANYALFRDVTLTSLLAGYVAYLFTKFGKAKDFGWFSDRDKIIEAYDGLALDLFSINHHCVCARDPIDSSTTRIAVGVPRADESGCVWYDAMNRLPDHIAGTLADWNVQRNWSTKDKFITMLEECIADNHFLVILRLTLEPNNFQCARQVVSKRIEGVMPHL